MFFENTHHHHHHHNHHDHTTPYTRTSTTTTATTTIRSSCKYTTENTETLKNENDRVISNHSLTLNLKATKCWHGEEQSSGSLKNAHHSIKSMTTSINNNFSVVVPKPAPRKIYTTNKLLATSAKPNVTGYNSYFSGDNENNYPQRHVSKVMGLIEKYVDANENLSTNSTASEHNKCTLEKDYDYKTRYLMNCLPTQQFTSTKPPLGSSDNKLLLGAKNKKQHLPPSAALSPKTLSNTHNSNEIPYSSSNNDIASSTDEDTEDSTDNKREKPKPGKLDLSQYDNITSAIGKLKVQPKTSTKASTSETSKLSCGKDQESGFFKNRVKKSKTRTQDSSLTKVSTKDSISLISHTQQKQKQQQVLSIDKEKQLEVRTTSHSPSIIRPSVISQVKKQKATEVVTIQSNNDTSLPQRRCSDERNEQINVMGENSTSIQPKESPTTSSEVKFGKVASIASTFLQTQSDVGSAMTTDNNDKKRSDKLLPKPAPRSGLMASARHTSVESGISLSTGSFGTSNISASLDNSIPSSKAISMTASTTTMTNSSTTSTSVGVSKKISNIRQNHGRAVAPPQLPPMSSLSGVDNILKSSDSPHNDLVRQLSSKTSDNTSIDINQSPIGHRLLQHYSKDYKVSELNSPHDSDSESPGAFKNYKLQRGQSSTSDSSSPGHLFTNSSIDSSELINSRGAAIRQLNEILANKQPPGRFGAAGKRPSASELCSDLNQEQSQQLTSSSSSSGNKKNDKDNAKKEKKKSRDDEKMEKRRLKEEERLKRQEKKLAGKKSKSGSSSQSSLGYDGIPLFIKRCIEFIELEGLDAEGIYRVPGNKAHVDAFVQKFETNSDMSILDADIPVNAVATALKDFLSKKWGPIIPLASMNELNELSNISERDRRVDAIRQLIKKLPQSNYNLLKYVFSHFVKVSHNHSLNSMDSKNLAICWWPTLLPLHFNDMVMFEQMRHHLEESIQIMIDQYDFIFDDETDPSSSANSGVDNN